MNAAVSTLPMAAEASEATTVTVGGVGAGVGGGVTWAMVAVALLALPRV